MTQMWPIWHPLVHATYGEELCFLGLRARDYGKTLEYLGKEFLERVSVYEVFGSFDILVRMFCTPGLGSTYRSRLEKGVGNIQAEFNVKPDDIYYMWGKKVPRISEASLREWPRSDLQEYSETWETLDQGIKDRLFESCVALGELADPTGREEIRCFAVIGTEFTSPRLVSELVDDIKQMSFLASFIVGIYVGHGLGFSGNILVEMGVPNEKYEDIIEVIRTLHKICILLIP